MALITPIPPLPKMEASQDHLLPALALCLGLFSSDSSPSHRLRCCVSPALAACRGLGCDAGLECDGSIRVSLQGAVSAVCTSHLEERKWVLRLCMGPRPSLSRARRTEVREGWPGMWGTEQECQSACLVCVGSELGCLWYAP